MQIPITQATLDAFESAGNAIIAALGDEDNYEQRRNVTLMLAHMLMIANGTAPENVALKNLEEFHAQLKALIFTSYSESES